MHTNNESKAVLITGARTGFGRYLAEQWLRRGARVIGCSREPTDLTHESYEHVIADVSDEHSVKTLFMVVRKSFGSLDILINNAGILSSTPVLIASSKTAEEVMRTNFHGTFLCSREAASLMKKKRYGRIVNVSSIAVLHAIRGNAIYGASKAAVEHFTRVFAKEVITAGITVNTVGLPPVEGTGMIARLGDAALAEATGCTLLKRPVTLAEAANAVFFFASSECDAITGQILYLGGC